MRAGCEYSMVRAMVDALVIGAGPAGLMAADILSAAGHSVMIAEAKPSPARKLLMAGKSGLNLTKDEPFEAFLANYRDAAPWLRPMLEDFSNRNVANWANGLGQETFTGSTGRVFPRAMKASPLLRAWLARLDRQGAVLRTGWRWTGWQGDSPRFETPDGPVTVEARATILALGGASWAKLGSDGGWRDILLAEGVGVTPFRPANIGFRIDWTPHMARHFGQPVKSVALIAGETVSRGEFVLTAQGIEGGGVYEASRSLRDGAPLALDLMPDLSLDDIGGKLAKPRGKASLANHLRKTLRLDPVRLALLHEFARPLPVEPAALARCLKHLPVAIAGPNPLDQAISTAGGVARTALDAGLGLHARPGVFCAGEMLDWEAPTGGYLLTACLATGRWAGAAAARALAAGV